MRGREKWRRFLTLAGGGEKIWKSRDELTEKGIAC
jgi:hypothetical protein